MTIYICKLHEFHGGQSSIVGPRRSSFLVVPPTPPNLHQLRARVQPYGPPKTFVPGSY